MSTTFSVRNCYAPMSLVYIYFVVVAVYLFFLFWKLWHCSTHEHRHTQTHTAQAIIFGFAVVKVAYVQLDEFSGRRFALKFRCKTNGCNRTTDYIFAAERFHPIDWIKFRASIGLWHIDFHCHLLVNKYHVSVLARKDWWFWCRVSYNSNTRKTYHSHCLLGSIESIRIIHTDNVFSNIVGDSLTKPFTLVIHKTINAKVTLHGILCYMVYKIQYVESIGWIDYSLECLSPANANKIAPSHDVDNLDQSSWVCSYGPVHHNPNNKKSTIHKFTLCAARSKRK